MTTQQLEAAPTPAVSSGEPPAPTRAEVQAAVARLPWKELSAFKTWFDEFFADEWDNQIERDALAGRLDHLMKKADEDFEAGRCTPL
jgi:hypothetical protein